MDNGEESKGNCQPVWSSAGREGKGREGKGEWNDDVVWCLYEMHNINEEFWHHVECIQCSAIPYCVLRMKR